MNWTITHGLDGTGHARYSREMVVKAFNNHSRTRWDGTSTILWSDDCDRMDGRLLTDWMGQNKRDMVMRRL